MNTVYVNGEDRRVFLDVPIVPTGPDNTKVFVDGEEVYSPPSIDASGDLITFTLPFSLVQSDKEIEVRWKFNYEENGQTYEYVNSTFVQVVTPILPLSEIKKILDDGLGEEPTQEEVESIERAVRYVIQAHTGQSFGKKVGKISVTGSGEPFLRLPRKLISFSTLNGSTHGVSGLAIRGSGWYLRSKSVFGPPPIRADWDGWNEANPYSGKVPIVAPNSRHVHNFVENMEYVIDGVWGYHSVPLAVQEAARLLVNDYACADSQYRDRFLTSMTAADWRIQFHEGAFSNTGNVRANQLLAEFVLHRGWVVI